MVVEIVIINIVVIVVAAAVLIMMSLEHVFLVGAAFGVGVELRLVLSVTVVLLVYGGRDVVRFVAVTVSSLGCCRFC